MLPFFKFYLNAACCLFRLLPLENNICTDEQTSLYIITLVDDLFKTTVLAEQCVIVAVWSIFSCCKFARDTIVVLFYPLYDFSLEVKKQ